MMTIKQVGILLLKLSSISYFVGAAFELSYIPEHVVEMQGAAARWAGNYEFEIIMYVVRCGINIGLGISFWKFAPSLSNLLAKGLDDDVPNVHDPTVWPPTPKNETANNV
jgi:hypothetical protein